MPRCLFAVLLGLTLAPSLAAAGPAQFTIQPTFFGIDQNNQRSPWPPTAAGAPVPVGALRLWDDAVKWTNIESCNPQSSTSISPADPSNPCYNWSTLDIWVRSDAVRAGMDVVYTLGGTPGFATSQVAPRTACETAGVYSCLPPVDVDKSPGSGLGDGTDAAWIDFLTALVTRYKGQIQFYELWNEPDSPNFFTGTNAQFSRMMKDAAATIRSIDPAARIISPSFHGPTAASWFAPYLARGGATDFDIVNFHGRGSGTSNIQAEAILTTYAAAQTVIVANGLTNRPFWDDEAGWLQNQVLDPDLQAAYVARSYILRASLGLARFYWYQWDSAAPYGLQGTVAGTAYAQVAHWLVGATISSCAKNGSVYSCPVTLGNGQQALILWNASASCSSGVCNATATTVDTRYVQYLDIAGTTVPIQNNSAPVSAKPILLEAVAPVTASLAVVNAASYSAALAPETIAAAFGSDLAAATGTTVVTVQSNGGVARPATLFYALPQQIAFLVPAGAATGPATVTVISGDGTVSSVTVQIATVAPGLFSANANGQGVAAADAVQGEEPAVPVFACGSAPLSCTPVPVTVNQTVIELYGTGIRGHSPTGVTCKIRGVDVPVQYAGPQSSPGLDQVNVALPVSLAKQGVLSIELTVDGLVANTVTIDTGAPLPQ